MTIHPTPPSRHLTRTLPLFLAAILLFLLDLYLPGATAAIGYCGLAVALASYLRFKPLLACSAFFTFLTWLGWLFEHNSFVEWMSTFDRFMVTGVLWLTTYIAWRLAVSRASLADTIRLLRAKSDELAASNTALQRFASVISHDLRSPLASISLNSQLLSLNLPRHDADLHEAAANIQAGLQDMNLMIQNLLDSAKTGNNLSPDALAPCDCEALLASVLSRLQAPLAAANATVTHDPLPTLPADAPQLSRVFQNLLENAIKYRSDADPRIHVSAAESDAFWTFTITDNGIGIHPDHAPRLFDMFQRGWSDERRYVGLGIGLAACKTIVERHGGRIWIDQNPLPGTTLAFTLPKGTPTISAGPPLVPATGASRA